jgi:hypothetical protein
VGTLNNRWLINSKSDYKSVLSRFGIINPEEL